MANMMHNETVIDTTYPNAPFMRAMALHTGDVGPEMFVPHSPDITHVTLSQSGKGTVHLSDEVKAHINSELRKYSEAYFDHLKKPIPSRIKQFERRGL